MNEDSDLSNGLQYSDFNAESDTSNIIITTDLDYEESNKKNVKNRFIV